MKRFIQWLHLSSALVRLIGDIVRLITVFIRMGLV